MEVIFTSNGITSSVATSMWAFVHSTSHGGLYDSFDSNFRVCRGDRAITEFGFVMSYHIIETHLGILGMGGECAEWVSGGGGGWGVGFGNPNTGELGLG